MDWVKFAWLKRGNRRIQVLTVISKSPRPLTINEVKQVSKIAMSQASLTVSELLSEGLIICENPNDKIGRLFSISKEGKEMLELLLESDLENV